MYFSNLGEKEKAKLDSLPPFKLKLTGEPTAEGILSIINYIKKTHCDLGYSFDYITNEYMQGSCGILADTIYAAYDFHPNIQKVLLRDKRDGLLNHAAIKLADTNLLFDINGQQTLQQLKENFAFHCIPDIPKPLKCENIESLPIEDQLFFELLTKESRKEIEDNRKRLIESKVAAHIVFGRQDKNPIMELFWDEVIIPKKAANGSSITDYCLSNIEYIPDSPVNAAINDIEAEKDMPAPDVKCHDVNNATIARENETTAPVVTKKPFIKKI